MKSRIKTVTRVFFSLLVVDLIVVGLLHTILNKPAVIDASGAYDTTVNYTEERIEKLMKRQHLPSVAVALIDDQDVVWHKVFGMADVENQIPGTADTVYRMWSVAKVFTAIEVMRLVEEGLIDLDAPLVTYLPDFSIQDRFPDGEPITIRSILSHQAGLPRNGCAWLLSSPQDEGVLREISESVRFCTTADPVGERYKYSNLGPQLLGQLIETVRGVPFADYIQESVLKPVGMDSSAFLAAQLPPQSHLARGYTYEKRTYHALPQEDITGLPSGNLYATLADMTAFVRFILNAGEAGGTQLIKPETLTMMFEDQYPNPRDPQPMGLGWKIAHVLDGELMIWHDGGPDEGTGALVAMLPERDLGVVLISNSTSFGGNISSVLAVDIFESMLAEKFDVVSDQKKVVDTVEIDPANYASYTGPYIVYGQKLDVVNRRKKLLMPVFGLKLELLPVGTDRFVLKHWLIELGILDWFGLPVSLKEVEVIFAPADDAHEAVMILNIAGLSYEVCPRYPVMTEVPAIWHELVGTYALSVRAPNGQPADDVFSHDSIWIDDKVLQ
ncbi:class A beta-lactamase-related serine hydrolase, partial [Candidatus Thorarchaeota archaeon]